MSNLRAKYRIGKIEEEFEMSEISEVKATEIFLKIFKKNLRIFEKNNKEESLWKIH